MSVAMRLTAGIRYRKRADALERVIEQMSVQSRRAMLEGLGAGPIIAGAYKVGPAICPGFAAYRRGARTGYTDFARAWDSYTRGRGVRQARRHELKTLVEMLRASLPAEPPTIAMNGNGNGHMPANGNGNGNGRVLERGRDLRGLDHEDQPEQVERDAPRLVGVADPDA